MTEIRHTYDHGNREIAHNGEIIRGLVGSTAHGINLPDTDDKDYMSVYIEPPEYVAGVSSPLDHFISRTQPDGARSGHGDIDLTCYSLRKYLKLALAGNPSILVLLFAQELSNVTDLGHELRELAPKIISSHASRRFLGYLDGQRERMVGEGKQNRVPNRPELIEKYGWDVKYGSHALRLAYQGIELTLTGSLTLPMSIGDRITLLKLRRGEVTFSDALEMVDHQRSKLAQLIQDGAGPLLTEPDLKAVNHWCVNAHYRFWRDNIML
jgi:predicted nucleotidyltransferase